jgi:hypothetical protein
MLFAAGVEVNRRYHHVIGKAHPSIITAIN